MFRKMDVRSAEYRNKLIVGLIAFGVSFLWIAQRDNEDVRQEAIDLYAEVLEDRALATELINKYHDECFDAAYNHAGRRRSAEFDADKYVQMMDQRMLPELHDRGYFSDRSPTRTAAAPRAAAPSPPPPPQLTPFEQAVERAGAGSNDKLKALAFFRDHPDPAHVSQINRICARLLNDDDDKVATTALQLLRYREPFKVSLLTDGGLPRNTAARKGVVDVLLDIDPARALEMSLDAHPQFDSDRPLIEAAVEKLGPESEKYLAAAVRETTVHSERGQWLFGLLAPRATRDSLAIVIDAAGDTHPEVSALAETAWKRIDPEGYDPVPALLRRASDDPVATVEGLASIEPKGSRDNVSRTLFALMVTEKDKLIDHADTFGKAMSAWGDDATVDRIMMTVKYPADEAALTLAAFVAAHRDRRSAIRPMLEQIDDHWDSVRRPLVIMGEAIEPDVLILARHSEPDIRIKAAELLGYVSQSIEARRELVKLARNDHDPAVRDAGRWAYNLALKRSRGQEVEITNRPTDKPEESETETASAQATPRRPVLFGER